MNASKRRLWDNLSAAYQRRLLRAGIDQVSYESGAALAAARGHSATPEHPERAARAPGKYPGYLVRKEQRALRMVWRPARADGLVSLDERFILVTGLSKPDRSMLGSYNNALRNYLANRPNHVADYGGRSVQGRQVLPDSTFGPVRRFELEASPDVLDDLAVITDGLQFESLYEAIQ